VNLVREFDVTRSTHVPLRRIVLCLDCESCFEIGAATCPACGSATWASLARFLDRTNGSVKSYVDTARLG
jgi:formate dehydrogenase maturation protein FdhE